jgi:hypothetical protein
MITMSVNSEISYLRQVDACNKHESSQQSKSNNVQTQALVVKIPSAEMESSRDIPEPNLTPAIIHHGVWA